jgi:endoglucanase
MRGPFARGILALTTAITAIAMVGHVHAARPAGPPRLPAPPPYPALRQLTPPLALAPTKGVIPGWLHTTGTTIVDANGRPIRLAAVNWYGAESTDFVPGGLAYRPYMDILRTIKGLGFNAIRLPFSDELVQRNPIVRLHLEANPQLRGKHALAILDTILNGARQVGLMVILDNHRSDAGWTAQSNGLWYVPGSPRYTAQNWINDWVTIATRYRNNPAVVGFDLRNEPHTASGVEVLGLGYLQRGATWGPFQGVDNPASDWRTAATAAGDAIQAVNPHVLIIVEGTELYPTKIEAGQSFCPGHADPASGYCPDVYWWGGNLAGAKNYPVVLNVAHHLVYSPHEYGPEMHGQRWITPTFGEYDWQQEMYRHWGYLLQATGPNAAPVWVGEFGTPTRDDSGVFDLRGNSQGRWFTSLVDYLKRYPNVGWGYWAINGTSSGGTDRSYGQRDIFGMLSSDWSHLSRPILLRALQGILPT